MLFSLRDSRMPFIIVGWRKVSADTVAQSQAIPSHRASG
jgi:hypothetical protein